MENTMPATNMDEITSGIDPRIMAARDECLNSNQLTPLIKEELRLTILSKRMKRGEGDISIERENTPKQRKLTPEELKKKERRREQNRRAARRCRKKKKEMESVVLKEYSSEVQKNKELEKEVEELRNIKMELERALSDHQFECKRPPTPFEDHGVEDIDLDDVFAADSICGQQQAQWDVQCQAPICPQQWRSGTPYYPESEIPASATSPLPFPFEGQITLQNLTDTIPSELESIFSSFDQTFNVQVQEQYINPDFSMGRQSISEYADPRTHSVSSVSEYGDGTDNLLYSIP